MLRPPRPTPRRWRWASVQGVTELFPVSISRPQRALHIPALVSGGWAQDLSIAAGLAVSGLHRRPAHGHGHRHDHLLLAGLAADHRRVPHLDPGPPSRPWRQRLSWMIILATIPVGIVGALLQHTVQRTLAKPVITAVFLTVNGLILFGGERLRRRQGRRPGWPRPTTATSTRPLTGLARFLRRDPRYGGIHERSRRRGTAAASVARRPGSTPDLPGPRLDETRIDAPPGRRAAGRGVPRGRWCRSRAAGTGRAAAAPGPPRGAGTPGPARPGRGTRLRRRASGPPAAGGRGGRPPTSGWSSWARAGLFLGTLQILALLPGSAGTASSWSAACSVPAPAGRGPALVPAVRAGHLRRRGAQAARPDAARRGRHPRPGPGGQLRLRH